MIKTDRGITYYIKKSAVYCYILTYNDTYGFDADYTACNEKYRYLCPFHKSKIDYTKKLMTLILTGLFT